MTITHDWLHRLDSATNYGELQGIFAEIAAEVESRPHDVQLAEQIDAAIQRLRGERERDERELNDVQSRYESFKQANRGFIGWIKRHLPFTETRRQELQHRSEVADQAAEILADNLVIARAQILKERLLPRERRRLGQRISDWDGQWARQSTQSSSAAHLMIQLNSEIEQSKAFLLELQRDVEAFAGAAFREAADRQRKDSDLAAARHELNGLQQEIDAEKALQLTGLKALTGQVASELSASDAEFRRDGQRIEMLQASLSRLEVSQTTIAKLVATVGQVGGLIKQLHSWPEQMQQARLALARTEAERTAAEQASTAKAKLVLDQQTRLVEAQRAADQAAQLVGSLKPAHDAHLAQRAAEKSMRQAVEEEPVAPIVQQYQMASGVAQQAQSQLREAMAALEAARREVAHLESASKAAADKLAAEQRKLSEFERKEPQIRSELAGHVDRGQREFAAASATLAALLNSDRTATGLPPFRPDELAAGTFGWLGLRGMEQAFANALLNSGQDIARHVQAATILDRLSQWHDAQKRSLDQERNQARSRRETVWKHRCRELLGDSLAEKACTGGLT